jgi:protein O-GlcNAc transferase
MCKNKEMHILANDHSSLFNEAADFFESGKLDEAKKCYEQILTSDGCNARALHAMGVIVYQERDIEVAIEYLQQVLQIQPDYATAYCSLGKIQKNLGRLLAARISYQKALELEPDSCETLCALGAICREMNQYEMSEEYLTKALTIDSSSSLAQYEFGYLHQKIKRYDSAIDHFVRAIELQPNYAEAYAQLALIYVSQGRQLEANDCLKNGLKLRPNSTTIRTILVFSMNYMPGVNPADIYAVSTDWARLATDTLAHPICRHHSRPDPESVLRIGFVSPDFRRHPVGYFVQSFMMLHDRDSFEVICYSDVRDEDELTQSLIESADKWRRVFGVKDDKFAEIIRRDRIDILVDLAGHTKDNRLNTFIMKPAPIQVTWAGYVGTTGLSAIDYLISDRFQSPDGAEEYTVERIIRMPDDYISYTPPEYAPDVAQLPARENGYITFGCFNNLAKVSEEVIVMWSEILKLVANSKLFIKNPSFDDQSTVERFIRLFEAHGISADRIVTEGQNPHQEMMARYSCIDIQLDTLPYSGGLTTLESLWMGVPVVTLPGDLFSSRHSLTHLMNVGLSECVAASREEYIAIACSLAGDLAKLSDLRQGLRDMLASSPICDGFGFTDNLQNVFRRMWSEWCETGVTDSGGDVETNSGVKEVEEDFLGDHIEYNEQGNRYSDEGNFDAAINCYKEALDIKPGYVEAYFNMGLVYYKAGNLEDAVRMFNMVICLSPDFAEAYTNLSHLYFESGRFSEAIAICNLAIGMLPDYPDSYNNLGNALTKLGQSEDALAAFRKALELKPENIQA